MLSSERSKFLWPDFDAGHAGAASSTPPHTSMFSMKPRQPKPAPARAFEAPLTSNTSAQVKEPVKKPASILPMANEVLRRPLPWDLQFLTSCMRQAKRQPTQINAEPVRPKNDKNDKPKTRPSLSEQVVKVQCLVLTLMLCKACKGVHEDGHHHVLPEAINTKRRRQHRNPETDSLL